MEILQAGVEKSQAMWRIPNIDMEILQAGLEKSQAGEEKSHPSVEKSQANVANPQHAHGYSLSSAVEFPAFFFFAFKLW